VAQADDSLQELRRLLRITMGLRHFKFAQVGPSQRAGTRMRSMIERFKVKMDRCAERYRAARRALLSLDPTSAWASRLRELKDEDIRSPHRGEDDDDDGEGNRTLSWIWLARKENARHSHETEVVDSTCLVICCFPNLFKMFTGLRVEWAKSRARAARWKEDIKLLTEEMRRVLEFFQRRSEWWLSRRTARSDVSPELADGLSAYGVKQHSILQRMGRRFGAMWWPILVANDLEVNWPVNFIPQNRTTTYQPAHVEVDAIDIFEDDFD
jgi:hypothetical protein